MAKVLDNLFIGNCEHGLNRGNWLDANNIRHVVSVLDSNVIAEKQVQLYQMSESKHTRARPIFYMHVNAAESNFEQIDAHFDATARYIDMARSNGEAVLVHDADGGSRAGAIVISYLIAVTRLPWSTCLKAVKLRRAQSVPNVGFQNLLAEFDRHIKDMPLMKQKVELSHFGDCNSGIKLVERVHVKQMAAHAA